MAKLTVLSLGGGQDSTAITLKMIYDQDFRKRYAPEDLVIIMSDTGNEHPHTYDNVDVLRGLSIRAGVPFHLLTSDLGYHTPAWQNLIEPQQRGAHSPYKETMVQTGTKSCTDRLKLVPIYKFLDEYINTGYGYRHPVSRERGCNKRAIKSFYEEYERIDVLIGFAKGEEHRADKSIKLQSAQRLKHRESVAKGQAGTWGHILNRVFPLIEQGMDRSDCVDYSEGILPYEVLPSNCMLCPYQSPAELLWLYRNHLPMWATWVDIEARKLVRYSHIEKNHGVYNSGKLLPERLEEAKTKFGHLTGPELHQYKKFHGCQTNTF